MFLTTSGKFFISILVEKEKIERLAKTDKKLGLNLGIATFVVCSDGQMIENPKQLRKSEKRLKKLQRDLSRKEKASKDRGKARLKVAKFHEKIGNQRKDFLHKLSTQLIKENQVIVIEDLRVKNMMQNHKLAKAIAEVFWSEFRLCFQSF